MRARSLPIITISILLIFLISCDIPSIWQTKWSSEPKPFSIESVTISRNMGEDFTPVNSTDEFPAGSSVIYISIKVNNMTPEDNLSVTWNYLETREEIDSTDFSPEETGSGYIGFKLTVVQGLLTGNYNALVYVNDEIYEIIEFSVK